MTTRKGLVPAAALLSTILLSCAQHDRPEAPPQVAVESSPLSTEVARDRDSKGHPGTRDPFASRATPTPEVAPVVVQEEQDMVVSLPPVPTPPPRDKDYRFVVPKQVELSLGHQVVGGRRTARLDLSVVGWNNGCPYVGPLEHEVTYQPDRLTIDIFGFEFGGPPSRNAICTADMQYATAEIPVDFDWLSSADDNEVVFRIKRKLSTYGAGYADHHVRLDHRRGSIIRPTRVLDTILFPMDVGELYIAGNVRDGRDYRDELRAFAEDKGWEPADEVYEGIPQPSETQLYVVVRNRKFPPPNRGDRVGSLGDGVSVYLSRIEDSF